MGRSVSLWLARFATVLALGAATLHAVPAQAAVATAITGKVTNNVGGAPVAGVRVDAIDPDGDYANSMSSDVTDSAGNYVLEGDPGTYKIRFSGPITTEYWNNATDEDSATAVVVAQGQTVTGKNAAVDAGGHIAGTVTDAAGALKYAQVFAYDAGGNFVADASTNSLGAYDLGVPAGTWRLWFTAGGHISEYFDNKSDLTSATTVTVAAGATVTGRNAALAYRSHVTGTVTKAGGIGLDGISVTLYQPDGDGGWDSRGYANTDTSGHYDISDVEAGTYRLCFDGYRDYLDECYSDKADVESAADIVVGASTTVSGKDAQLTAAGHITGTVTRSAGGPVVDGSVVVYDAGGNLVDYADTDDSGNYDAAHLPAGNYRLRFDSYDGDASEYWNDKATLVAADPIAVTAGATASGKNATLGAGAHITGTVTRDNGGPVNNVDVTAYDSAGTEVRWTSSDASGAYDLDGLNAGTYRLRFQDYDEEITEYYNNSATLAGATGIVVGPSQTVSGKNISLAGKGHITGKVTRAGGFGVGSVLITLYDSGFNEIGYATTYDDGTYDLTPVQAGNYTVGFSKYGYVDQYFNSKSTINTATFFSVAASATVSGRNAVLVSDGTGGGFIGGTVTKVGGTPIDQVDVCVWAAAQPEPDTDNPFDCVGRGFTAADGKYGIDGLAAGQYKVRFYDDYAYDGAFDTQYYNNKASAATATAINVTSAGEAFNSVNAVLAEHSHVTGRVTKADGVTPIPDIDVTLLGGSGDYYPHGDYTKADGTFDIVDVPAGTYTLEFKDWDGVYATEYYDNALTEAGATSIIVPANTVVSGKNASLTVGAHITGSIAESPSDGNPACVYVTAYDSQGNEATYSQVVGSTYDLGGLQSGTYVLGFVGTDDEDCVDGSDSESYAPEYFDNSPTFEGATQITVTAPNTVSGKNVVLDKKGTITGTVTKTAGGTPLADIQVTAYNAAGEAVDDYEDDDYTGVDGTYRLELPAGTYRLRFQDDDGLLATEYYNNSANLSGATGIVVGAGQAVTGRNADLGAASLTGHITGKVTKQDGTTAIQGIRVRAYGDDGWGDPAATAYTDASGNYDLAGLNGDDYKVQFLDVNGSYNTEWFDDAGNRDDATLVSVANGATVTGKNARLAGGTDIQNDVAPSISGIAKVGSTLTADNGQWTPTSGVAFTRQWLANGVVIPSATGTTYVPVAGDVGKAISVKVTATKAGLTTATKTSAGTPAVVSNGVSTPITNSTLPTITGTAQVGQTLTASNGTWSTTPDSYVYAWKAGGTAVGTNANTYVPVAGDLGKTITVTVTAKKTGFTDGTATSAATAAVVAAAGTLSNTALPVISGTARVGQQLSATSGTWSATPDSYTFQWKANGTAIAGATAHAYTPVAGDVGKTITVTVTAKKAGFTDGTATSTATAAVTAAPAALTNSALPTITGSPIVGQTLTASNGTWSATPDSFTYQWVVGGVQLRGATSKTYVPTTDDVGKTITVKVTANKAGSTPGTATSAATAAVTNSTLTNTALPTISGTAKVGQTLTASNGTWSATPDSFTYQWKVDGTNAGTNANTYVPVVGDTGKKIRVTVTAKKTGSADATATSAATDAVTSTAFTTAPVPTITGTAKVGQTLTAVPGSWSPTPQSFAYQWKVGGASVRGGGSSTYVPTSADVGKSITVTVSATKPNYDPVSRTSAATANVVP